VVPWGNSSRGSAFPRVLLRSYLSGHARTPHTVNAARSQASEALITAEQVEYLLEFAEWLLGRVAGIWNSASLPNKLRIQAALFPDGLRVSKEGLGTPLRPLFFKQFQEISTEQHGLASPGGFEPPLPP
jgi:hypothetical protein